MAIRALSAGELLSVWERGAVRGPAERGLMLLAAASPEEPIDELLALTLDERDRRLLCLRQMTFGPQLDCQVACPAGGETLEVVLDARAIAAAQQRATTGDTGEEPDDVVEHEGWRVRFCLPCVQDVLDACEADAATGRQMLLTRCVRGTASPGSTVEWPNLPEGGLPREVEAALLAALQQRDEEASVLLDLHCPQCGHAWRARFDVLSFFWSEISGWAGRTLREVHLLASSYGWREADILALSAWRRQAYLQMNGHA